MKEPRFESGCRLGGCACGRLAAAEKRSNQVAQSRKPLCYVCESMETITLTLTSKAKLQCLDSQVMKDEA